MKLTEIAHPLSDDAVSFLNTVCGQNGWTQSDSGAIIAKADVTVPSHLHLSQLPVAFESAGKFRIYEHDSLTTLKGAPRHCRSFEASWCIGLEDSIQYLPRHVALDMRLVAAPITSFSGIHKIVKSCRFLYLPDATHILGAFLIEGLDGLKLIGATPELNALFQEILKIPYGQRDINLIQEQLIDAGYAKYARL